MSESQPVKAVRQLKHRMEAQTHYLLYPVYQTRNRPEHTQEREFKIKIRRRGKLKRRVGWWCHITPFFIPLPQLPIVFVPERSWSLILIL